MNTHLTHKNEISQQELDEITALFEAGTVQIKWFSVTRAQQKGGCKSRWGIFTRLDETENWKEEGELWTINDEISPVLMGNVYEDLLEQAWVE